MGKKGNYTKSIEDSLVRIIKANFGKIDNDSIIICTVQNVYSDESDLNTYGTFDAIDLFDETQYLGISVNAHINEDGTTTFGGEYKFPKIGSEVCIVEYGGDENNKFYVPMLFSHITKVTTIYDEEYSRKLIGVDTSDATKPYDTTPNGKEVTTTETLDTTEESITDGSTTSKITKTVSVIDIDTNGSDGVKIGDSADGNYEPATLSEKLYTHLISFIDELGETNGVLVTVDPNTGQGATSSKFSSSPTWATMRAKFVQDFEEFKSSNVKIN